MVTLRPVSSSPDTTSPKATDALWATLDRWDEQVDQAFATIRGNPVVDRIFYGAAELGDHSLVWHLIATGTAARSLGAERAAVRLIASLALESGLVNGLVKSLFNRSRPIIEEPRPLRLRIPRTSSFPSGHASSATMAASLLAQGSRLGPIYRLAAAVVALSRIHVRIHHASDVAGGVAVGAALAAIIKRLWPL